ncbi:hypothetical protein BDV96DRAFT_651594 [Lophiotrema nucula]|uniref:F-box domain-containing protein n=1 Tax=Lophiotrema nucula TaxID=690887 RepID=A0A6A5YR87_9PLEO|nr:hypothetical protein BDV96DRAFT_651594 [Lophiotrema nucula]
MTFKSTSSTSAYRQERFRLLDLPAELRQCILYKTPIREQAILGRMCKLLNIEVYPVLFRRVLVNTRSLGVGKNYESFYKNRHLITDVVLRHTEYPGSAYKRDNVRKLLNMFKFLLYVLPQGNIKVFDIDPATRFSKKAWQIFKLFLRQQPNLVEVHLPSWYTGDPTFPQVRPLVFGDFSVLETSSGSKVYVRRNVDPAILRQQLSHETTFHSLTIFGHRAEYRGYPEQHEYLGWKQQKVTNLRLLDSNLSGMDGEQLFDPSVITTIEGQDTTRDFDFWYWVAENCRGLGTYVYIRSDFIYELTDDCYSQEENLQAMCRTAKELKHICYNGFMHWRLQPLQIIGVQCSNIVTLSMVGFDGSYPLEAYRNVVEACPNLANFGFAFDEAISYIEKRSSTSVFNTKLEGWSSILAKGSGLRHVMLHIQPSKIQYDVASRMLKRMAEYIAQSLGASECMIEYLHLAFRHRRVDLDLLRSNGADVAIPRTFRIHTTKNHSSAIIIENSAGDCSSTPTSTHGNSQQLSNPEMPSRSVLSDLKNGSGPGKTTRWHTGKPSIDDSTEPGTSQTEGDSSTSGGTSASLDAIVNQISVEHIIDVLPSIGAIIRLLGGYIESVRAPP